MLMITAVLCGFHIIRFHSTETFYVVIIDTCVCVYVMYIPGTGTFLSAACSCLC